MQAAYSLTQTQREIRDCEDASVLVVAPPGAGKTEVLALRAAAVLERQETYPHSKVLALTFSNRARDNLSQRLAQVLGYRQFRQHVTVCNFHGLASRIYYNHGSCIGHEPNVMKPPRRGWLNEVLSEHKITGVRRQRVIETLHDLKLNPYSDAELVQRLAAQPGDKAALQIEVARQHSHQLDYDDLLRLAQIVLKCEPVARIYATHFSYALVDEFQDLTSQQLDIIEAIFHRNVTWVGDPGQGIYSFTGANAVDTERRLRSNSTVFELQETHRSSPAVVDMLNAVNRRLDLRIVTCGDPSRWPSGGAAEVATYSDQETEARCLRYRAEAILGDHIDASIGVITRTDYRRSYLDKVFDESFLWPVTSWKSAITSSETAKILQRHLTTITAAGESAAAQVSSLFDATFAEVDPADVESIEDLRICREWLTEHVDNGGSLAGGLDRLVVADRTDTPIRSGVHLLNGHTGKGQQFDYVFVCGLEAGSIPHYKASTYDDVLEELRLLRVMLSRAKNACIVTRCRYRRTALGWRTETESPWWPLLESTATY